MPNSDREFRVFCAYGPKYQAPGCGFERYVDDEQKAAELAKEHERGARCAADYERVS